MILKIYEEKSKKWLFYDKIDRVINISPQSKKIILEYSNFENNKWGQGDYELNNSPTIAELIIRPTGLVDPIIEVRKTEGQIDNLLSEIHETVERGFRILVTTLTKKMSEDLTDFLIDQQKQSFCTNPLPHLDLIYVTNTFPISLCQT